MTDPKTQWQIVSVLPEGYVIVAMTILKDRLYVATQTRVFCLKGRKLEPLRFVVPPAEAT